MEAQGSDGIVRLDAKHLTITWSSLRGRLSSAQGDGMEVLPLSEILDSVIELATENRRGLFQVQFQAQNKILSRPTIAAIPQMFLEGPYPSYLVLFTKDQEFAFRNLNLALQRNLALARARMQDVLWKENQL
jgi:hypothetical protein